MATIDYSYAPVVREEACDMSVAVEPDDPNARPPVRRCHTCAFWVRGEDTSWGGCSSPKFNRRAGDVEIDTDGVELGGWALFGADFGCVHWESIYLARSLTTR